MLLFYLTSLRVWALRCRKGYFRSLSLRLFYCSSSRQIHRRFTCNKRNHVTLIGVCHIARRGPSKGTEAVPARGHSGWPYTRHVSSCLQNCQMFLILKDFGPSCEREIRFPAFQFQKFLNVPACIKMLGLLLTACSIIAAGQRAILSTTQAQY